MAKILKITYEKAEKLFIEQIDENHLKTLKKSQKEIQENHRKNIQYKIKFNKKIKKNFNYPGVIK